MSALPRRGPVVAAVGLGFALTIAGGVGQTEEKSGGDLRAATQNPISSMYSLPFKFTFDNGADNGDASFSGDKVTLPLGGGVGRIFKIGKQPMNTRVEGYYNVIHPDAAPHWTIGGTIQFLFPK